MNVQNRTMVDHYFSAVVNGKIISYITPPGCWVDAATYPELAEALTQHNREYK